MPDTIHPDDLIPMDLFARREPIAIDLVYADASHPENIFNEAAYHDKAPLVVHRDLARVIVAAARIARESHGWTLVLKDGLRPVEAQHALIQTRIAQANPHWVQEGPDRLLSLPGSGAHPRGMAIDVAANDERGRPVDMGTSFDAMVPESARAYNGFPDAVHKNRSDLERAFAQAATHLSLPMLPLPSEWWDFRFPAAHYDRYEAIRDADLPDSLKMCTKPTAASAPEKFERLANAIILSL